MEQKHPETGYNFFRDLRKLGRAALYFISGPHELSDRGNHDFKNNHLPVPDSEAIEPTITGYDHAGYPHYDDEQLYLGQSPEIDAPRTPRFGGTTRDARGL